MKFLIRGDIGDNINTDRKIKKDEKMIDYLKKESWAGFRESEMAQLEFSAADSVFIFTQTEYGGTKHAHLLFADDFKAAAGYFIHVYLCDLIGDVVDSQRFDLSQKSTEHLRDTLLFGKLRMTAISAMKSASPKNRLLEVIEEFNSSQQSDFRCTFRLCFGVDELRALITEKYKESMYFNFDRLRKICTANAFNGAELKEYIKKLMME